MTSSKNNSLRKNVWGLKEGVYPSKTMCVCLMIFGIEVGPIGTNHGSVEDPLFSFVGKVHQIGIQNEDFENCVVRESFSPSSKICH